MKISQRCWNWLFLFFFCQEQFRDVVRKCAESRIPPLEGSMFQAQSWKCTGGNPAEKSTAAKINVLGETVHAQKPRSTFSPRFPQLPILNEASKHLRLHEDAQETTDALGGHGLAKRLSLEDPLSTLVLRDEQGVMSHRLQEEADEGLWHQAVQGVIL